MQDTNTTKVIERILRQYCDRKSSSPHQALEEVALFLYEQKREPDNFTHMVRCAFGPWCKYSSDLITKEDEAFLLDHYLETIEVIIDPSFDGGATKMGLLQPKELTEFAASFFKPEKEYSTPLLGGESTCISRFYNPFTGLASYELALPEYEFWGDEVLSNIWALANIRMHAHGISGSIYTDDFFSTKWEQRFKGIISTPPFGLSGERSIDNIVTKLYDLLDENGQMVIIIPSGFLFGTSRSAIEIRRRLLEDKAVTDVVLLPEGLFYGTGIQTAVLVVEKSIHSSVNLIDASAAFKTIGKNRIFDAALLSEGILKQDSEFPVAQKVVYEELLNDDCNLYPARYLSRTAIESGYRLSSLAEVVKLSRVANEVPDALFFSPSGLRPDFARTPIDESRLERRTIKPGRYFLIESPVVVFDYNPHSDKVRVAYLEEAPSEPIYASEFTVVLKPNETVSPFYLMLILSDKKVRRQMAGIITGVTIRRMNLSQVSDLIVPARSLEEQDNMVREAMKASMSQSEIELDAAFAKYKKAIHSRKHALAQNISSLSALWNAFENYRQRHESISGTDMIGRKHARSVDDICNTISTYLKTICDQTNAIANDTYDWGKVEWLDLPLHISQYIRKHKSTEYDLINAGYDSSDFDRFASQAKEFGMEEAIQSMLNEQTDEPPYENIKFASKALDRILDDIVANAVAHGFVDKNRDDYRICFDWKEEDSNVVLYVSNNGAPLHPELDSDEVLEYGRSTSLNEHGHSGIGGYEIQEIMERFGGFVEVLSTPEEEYTVTYKLTFTRVSRYLPEDEIDY